ncbi:hypothetical protein MTO96_047369 [Rhipicephalus appendiculatus]
MAASARMPLDAGRDDTDGMDCRDVDAHDLATSRDSNTSDAGGPRQRELDRDWQIALTLRQRKAQARERKQKTPDHPDASSQPLPSDGRTQERPRKKPKYRRLPPLPRDDFKVIVRPHQGLPIKSLTSPALADAVIAACGGLITVNAYVATGEGATRGVVHGLQARMLGDTKTAVITFYGGVVPRCVYYRGGELPCYPYKNTTQVCKVCYHVGHRSDVCPQPDTRVCRICGMRDPVPSHECSPKVCNLRRRPPYGRSHLQEEAQTSAPHTLQHFQQANIELPTRASYDKDEEASPMVQLRRRRPRHGMAQPAPCLR